MTLQELGFTEKLDAFWQKNNLKDFEIGRISSEHKERYTVITPDHEYEGEIIGNLRYSAQSRADYPAVGDWVAITAYEENKVLIHAILPRRTSIERQAVGKFGEKQIIATNIDVAFIVQAVDRDFSVNRIERYLTICNSAHVDPIILLNKVDLLSETELEECMQQMNSRIKNVPFLAISNQTRQGIQELNNLMQPGKTYCLLGSSGVGKSSLINSLSRQQKMKTDTISTHSNRGQHVTTHRQMLLLEQGSIIIDNPGMREVGISDDKEGLELTFDSIHELAEQCRYSDCTHTTEKGCAVIQAVSDGLLNESVYQNYLKMEREQTHFNATIAEKRRKDKAFGKMVKNVMKHKKKY